MTALARIGLVLVCLACPALGQTPSTTTFGTSGLVDMPSAQSTPDAELSATFSYSAAATRTTLTFQITPRFSGSFRYSGIEAFFPTGTLYDRSFDLQYRLLDEGRIRPAVAIGLRDFIGTGIYSGEYVVATKHLTPKLAVTGGLGWGRFGSHNGFSNPLGGLGGNFRSRPQRFIGNGGLVESARWFAGDAALFAGASWQATARLTLKAEYSSDAYTREVANGVVRRASPFNFGLNYRLSKGVDVQLAYLFGTEISAGVTFKLNAKEPAIRGGSHPAPQPVRVRLPSNIRDLGWTVRPNVQASLRKTTADLLAADGLTLEAMIVRPKSVTLRLRNGRYSAGAEAIGRTARILSRTMPASVETFTIVPVVRGIAVSQVTLSRAALEAQEHAANGAALSYASARLADGAVSGSDAALIYDAAVFPRFRWGLGPYVSASYFDPDSPIRAELGAQLSASYDIAPGLVLSGTLRKPLVGNKASATRVSDSVIRRVRSDARIYDRQGDPAIKDLTLAYYFRPGQDLYGRVTLGYLETMYAGLSTELLWKPVNSSFGLGAEINYLRQRDFDQLFGLQAYQVTTGHLSAYWNMGNGFHSEVSLGRYLGGDVGGTVKLERVFKNGWRIGGYATLTDTSFADFGEGSFDKGLTFTVPLDHFLGTPTGRKFDTVLQPLTRDGGARVKVDGRLYETVRAYHRDELQGNWGRFWR